MLKHCCICGAEFFSKPSDKRTTCGRQECRAERRRQQFVECRAKYEEYRKQRHVTVTCEICGKPFELLSCKIGHKRTCSDECRSELKRRNGLAQFDGGKQLVKNCCVCGKTFRTSPSVDQKTCSNQCRRELMRRIGSGNNLTEMRTGRDNSPVCQTDERHFAAKNWKLRGPDGNVYEFRNLAHFVRTHRELFSPEHLKKSGGKIYAIHLLGCLRPERKKMIHSWCGWSWVEE